MQSFHLFVPDHKKNEVPAVFFTILDRIYDKYLQAAKRIIAVPHHKLVTEHEVVPVHKAKRVDQQSLKWLVKHPERVARVGSGVGGAHGRTLGDGVSGSSVSRPNYKYVFDAKYKIEMNPEDAFYPDDKPGPKVEDINTMHRYRDAIVYENPQSRFVFEKTMFGAYILFPYGNEEEYAEGEHRTSGEETAKGHRFYRSIDSVNIGGLPFLPSATGLVEKLLESLVEAGPEEAWEHTSFPVGSKAKRDEMERLVAYYRSIEG